ncbi:hypothetical protein CsSME_00025120 [Camellia sinensis var. sinensis]
MWIRLVRLEEINGNLCQKLRKLPTLRRQRKGRPNTIKLLKLITRKMAEGPTDEEESDKLRSEVNDEDDEDDESGEVSFIVFGLACRVACNLFLYIYLDECGNF